MNEWIAKALLPSGMLASKSISQARTYLNQATKLPQGDPLICTLLELSYQLMQTARAVAARDYSQWSGVLAAEDLEQRIRDAMLKNRCSMIIGGSDKEMILKRLFHRT